MLLEVPAPDVDPASPWWAWPLSLAAWAVLTWLLNRRTRKDVGEIKEQVQNTHSTNLRDDVDALAALVREGLQGVRDGLKDVRDDVGGLHSETRDLRQDVAGIRSDGRHDRRELKAQREAFEEHLADVPKVIAEAVEKHVAACPVRQEFGE